MSKHVLDSLKQYKQKSFMFLYPLLQISNDYIKPVDTFLKIKDLDLQSDKTLIACYYNKEKNFGLYLTYLKTTQYYLSDFNIKDATYVVFDFSKMPNTYNKFLKGSYSDFSENAKIVLSLTQKPLVLRAIYPEHFVIEYSMYFKQPIDSFPKELIEAPNIKKETLSFTKEVLKNIEKRLTVNS